jgi:hypothetical protein
MENVEVLAHRLILLEINNDLPDNLDNYQLDDDDPEIRRITYTGGNLASSREIVLTKVRDKGKEGNIITTVLTEIPD